MPDGGADKMMHLGWRRKPVGKGRLVRLFLLVALVFLVVDSFAADRGLGQAGESDSELEEMEASDFPFLDVVEVDGPIDSLVRDFLEDALEEANADERVAGVLLRVDTPGSLDQEGFALAEKIRDSRVPVIVWVGRESGRAQARGAGLLLVAAAHLVGVSPDAELGPLSPEDLKRNEPVDQAGAEAQFEELVPRNKEASDFSGLVDKSVGGDEALELGVADFEAPFLGAVLAGADGRSAVLSTGEVVQLDLTTEETVEGELQAPPVVITRFRKLQGVPGFLHKINTPTYAYVLLVIGLAAIVFEYFASSIGIAGGLGALCLLASFEAMGVLPVNWWAVALIAAAVLLMSVDVQISNLGVLTIAGTAFAVVGSVFFTYVGDYRVRWWVLLLCLVGLVLFYAIAMTTVVRTRFSTPTIGREALVGAQGETASELDPDGLVTISGATWKARAHRGRIALGQPVTVRAVDGLVLEVDPSVRDAGDAETRAD